MIRYDELIAEARRYCTCSDLRTHDPYDIWMTSLGYRVKDLFNRRRAVGILPASALTLFDMYINNRRRWFYRRREYPIVRAWAAMIMLNVWRLSGNDDDLAHVRKHLDWLLGHSCTGYSGPCWGLGFDYAVSADFQYDDNMPLSTMTPYVLEAMADYGEATGDARYADPIRGMHAFFEHDLVVMDESSDWLVTSYAAMRDRRVVNAVSYVMYAYSRLLPYLAADERAAAENRAARLHRYVEMHQQNDGSWFYSPDGDSFVDCFHSCIVLKNLIKTGRRLPGLDAKVIVSRGYEYVKQAFYVDSQGLFKRFSVANKPSLVRFDLYDNAEMLNLAHLMQDTDLVASLTESIARAFRSDTCIFSQIDFFGFRQNANTLRWALLPYLYALSVLAVDAASMEGEHSAA